MISNSSEAPFRGAPMITAISSSGVKPERTTVLRYQDEVGVSKGPKGCMGKTTGLWGFTLN